MRKNDERGTMNDERRFAMTMFIVHPSSFLVRETGA